MDISGIQRLLDQVKPIRPSSPFDLYVGPEGLEHVNLRVHWDGGKQRWIYCQLDSCTFPHVSRELRYAAYLTDDGSPAKAREDIELVLAPPMLLRAENQWMQGQALIRFGTSVDTVFSTCERTPAEYR